MICSRFRGFVCSVIEGDDIRSSGNGDALYRVTVSPRRCEGDFFEDAWLLEQIVAEVSVQFCCFGHVNLIEVVQFNKSNPKIVRWVVVVSLMVVK